MAKKVYHKLVRDKIPDIIRAQGNMCKTRILTDEEYLAMLDLKLQEEMQEYLEKHDPEEMADLLEVIRALALAHGSSMADVERIRAEKARMRGGFEQRILLEEVEEREE